jgi:hypothetical protein
MYDPYIVKRTQIYLDEDAARTLAARAARRGMTMSHLIREAIGEYLVAPADESVRLQRQRAALYEAFGTIRRLPDGATFVQEMRSADVARDRELEDQWLR